MVFFAWWRHMFLWRHRCMRRWLTVNHIQYFSIPPISNLLFFCCYHFKRTLINPNMHDHPRPKMIRIKFYINHVWSRMNHQLFNVHRIAGLNCGRIQLVPSAGPSDKITFYIYYTFYGSVMNRTLFVCGPYLNIAIFLKSIIYLFLFHASATAISVPAAY